MLVRRFESLLAEELGKTDLAQRAPDDMPLRFESLRGYRLLPAGRTKNVTPLSVSQMASAILSIATPRPGFAGLAAKVLGGLLPIGRNEAAFYQSLCLADVVEKLLSNPGALDSLIELRVSDSEMYTNAHGRGAVMYRSGDAILTAYFVHGHAAGAQDDFDPRDLISSAVTETIFYPPFFRRIVRELEREAAFPTARMTVPPEDEDEETKKEERIKRLGILPNSRFLHLGVDGQVTWPSKEIRVDFEGYRLILLPRTAEHSASISVDLRGQKITAEAAMVLANRLLSLMTWCDDQCAILQEGWSGNPIPVPVPKRSRSSTTANMWLFDRKIPVSAEAAKALAIYREGRNAEQNYLISYAVLSYYKIIELRHRGRAEARSWFGKHYDLLRQERSVASEVARFEEARGKEEPGAYLYRACRVAVAHANKPYSSDPDEIEELRRLNMAASILRALARRFIRDELKVSEVPYDGT
jgi:hypothetical protein